MPAFTTLLAFSGATILLVLLPGPNLLFILGAGISGGRRTALAAAVGVELGTLVHVLAAAVGLSAVLQTSATAFSTVKYLGAAYLVYLGVRALRATHLDEPGQRPESQSTLSAVRRGVFVNVLNPKVALFFLAFLPQFIDADRSSSSAQIMVLGSVFFAIALAIDLVYAIAAGGVGRWLARRPSLLRRQERIAGVIYLSLAALAISQGTQPSETT